MFTKLRLLTCVCTVLVVCCFIFFIITCSVLFHSRYNWYCCYNAVLYRTATVQYKQSSLSPCCHCPCLFFFFFLHFILLSFCLIYLQETVAVYDVYCRIMFILIVFFSNSFSSFRLFGELCVSSLVYAICVCFRCVSLL